jgi:Spy/CpxP family protein refolding chaperone
VKFIRWFVLIALLLPAAASAQRGDRPMGRVLGAGQRPPARREALEAQVFNRFMTKVSGDLRLDAGTKQRLTAHVQQNGQQRRQLAQQTVQLRRRLQQAARDSTVNEAEVEGLLGQFEQLRVREQELWNREQAALGQILSPRQRAQFILQWMQFNERIRDLVQQREEPGIPR